MITDPYSVLGISRDATPEEIKKAYRAQAKKYHPDLHPDDPKAAAKMNEINEAYDMLNNPQKYAKYRSSQNTYSSRSQGYQGGYYNRSEGYNNSYSGRSGYSGQGYNQQGPGGWSSDYWGFDFSDLFGFGFADQSSYDTKPKPENGDSVDLVRAISSVNQGRYNDAITILSHMTSAYRNARWYYVSAVAFEGLGDYAEACNMIERAIKLDPENRIYSYLYRKYRSASQSSFGQNEYSYTTVINPFRTIGRFILGFMIFQFILRLLGMLLLGGF